MQIVSHAFLLIILPLSLLVYWKLITDSRTRLYFLLALSYGFYALAGWQFLPILIGLSWATYFLSRRGWFGAGVLLNLVVLALFKYWDFGGANIASALGWLDARWAARLLAIGLPLGLSFFVFKHIGYLLDVRASVYPASDDFWLFAAFSAYFPQISAGPISSFGDTGAQLAALPGKLEPERAYQALLFISIGLAKKILIADSLTGFLEPRVGNPGGVEGLFPAWYLVVVFAMQLYFDFSGYTDLVLGISLLFGVVLPPNFNNPYVAKNIADFWERWHISLSTWFRHYVYFPLSRGLLKRWGWAARDRVQGLSNFVTMTLIGLWHGVTTGYVLWGMYHGVLLNLHAWSKKRNWRVPAVAGRIVLLGGLMIGTAIFLSPDGPTALHLLSQMSGLHGLGDASFWPVLIRHASTPAAFAGLVLAFSGMSEAADVTVVARQHRVWNAALFGVLAAVSILFLQESVEFVYVQF